MEHAFHRTTQAGGFIESLSRDAVQGIDQKDRDRDDRAVNLQLLSDKQSVNRMIQKPSRDVTAIQHLTKPCSCLLYIIFFKNFFFKKKGLHQIPFGFTGVAPEFLPSPFYLLFYVNFLSPYGWRICIGLFLRFFSLFLLGCS